MSKHGGQAGARPATGPAAETGAALFANVRDFFRISGLGLRKEADATERVPPRGTWRATLCRGRRATMRGRQAQKADATERVPTRVRTNPYNEGLTPLSEPSL